MQCCWVVINFSMRKKHIQLGQGRISFYRQIGGLAPPLLLGLTCGSLTYNPFSSTTVAPLFLLWHHLWMGECFIQPLSPLMMSLSLAKLFIHVLSQNTIIWPGLQHFIRALCLVSMQNITKCEIKTGCPEAVHCTIPWACEITLGHVVCASDMWKKNNTGLD